MSMNRSSLPSNGEIWLVNFEPQVGSEIGKKRPAVVISKDDIGKLPLKIVVPVTDWKKFYLSYPWFTHLVPSVANGLTKESGVDSFQIKSLSLDRFGRKLGKVTRKELEDIIICISFCIGT